MNPTQTTYDPPISQCEFPTRAWHPITQLAVGVRGFTYEKFGFIFIPLIVAEREGAGDVGRFLDRLSVRCVIQSVTSKRLEGMLVRRGFEKVVTRTDDFWMRR